MVDSDEVLRLLMLQIQQPHSQIRLGVVKLIEFLTSDCAPISFASKFCEAILLHLQVNL